MEYSQVSKDQQIQILKGRIAGWEADHYGWEINLAAIEASGGTESDLKTARDNLNTLEASINAGRAKLAELDDDSTVS